MGYSVKNVCDRAVGLPGGATLPPGETAVFADLSSADLKALEGFPHVEVQNLDRPKGGRDKKPAAKA